MLRRWRWAVVAVGTAVLLVLPWAITRLPAHRSTIDAATLLTRVRASAGVAYSGYAESVGGLQLPDTRQLNSVASLVGGRSQLRVWYARPDFWRVDSITPTGETDLHLDDRLLWKWDYESNEVRATVLTDGQVHLPRASDLTPPDLARRLLSGAPTDAVVRLPTRRIAGRSAAGLRFTPSESESTIRAVDVWADPRTGLPLLVQALAKDGGLRPIESRFLDVRIAAPAQATINFSTATRSVVQFRQNEDLLSSLDTRFARAAPDELAGLPRVHREGITPAVALYGRSVTTLVLVPMPDGFADSLLFQLSRATAIPVTDSGGSRSITIGVGPVNLQVISGPDSGYVLAGTVTADAMQTALTQLDLTS
jgi:outer membrane lipoprotein-sorting protein